MLLKVRSKLVPFTPYLSNTSTNRRDWPAHCCIHSQTSIAAPPSWKSIRLAAAPGRSVLRFALVGAFGSFTAFDASRKLLHPAAPARRDSPSNNALCRITSRLPLSAVEAHGEHEGARLRQVEVVRAAAPADRAAEVRLGIEARVLRPRLQVASGDADIQRRQAQAARDPRLIELVADGDLAQLDVAAVLDALLVDAAERTGREKAVAIPVLSNRHRQAGARADDRSRVPAIRAEGLQVARAGRRVGARADGAHRRLGVRAVAPQRALGTVVDVAALADVEQSGQGQLLVPVAGAHVARPVRVRVAQHALGQLFPARHARVPRTMLSIVDVQRPSRLVLARARETRHLGGVAQPAADPAVAVDHTERIAFLRDEADRGVVDEEEVRPCDVLHERLVAREAEPDGPRT